MSRFKWIIIRKSTIFIIIAFAAVAFWGYNISSVEKSSNLNAKKINRYRLESIKTIGVEEAEREDEEVQEFASIFSVTCDDKGYIYALDGKANCVKKFNVDGKYIGKFFQRGKGPEDISNAYKVVFNKYSGTLFVLNEYGYQLKEFSPEGKFVKSYRLPEQFFHHFEFLDKKTLVFSALEELGKRFYYNFKVLNLETGNITKRFALTTRDSTLNYWQTFALQKSYNLFWTAPTDEISLVAYNLNNFKREKTLSIPGYFKRNKVIHFTKNGGRKIRAVYYNIAQPFWFRGMGSSNLQKSLFFLLKTQELKEETPESVLNPITSKLELFHVMEDHIQNLGILKDCESMRLGTTHKNRLILYGSEPFPKLKILEISESS